jgi:hypothetical protein
MFSMNNAEADLDTQRVDDLLAELMSAELAGSASDTAIDMLDVQATKSSHDLNVAIAEIAPVAVGAAPEDFAPQGLAHYSLKVFFGNFNWKNDPTKVWPPRPKVATPVLQPATTASSLSSIDMPIPVAALGLKQFMGLVNWKNDGVMKKRPCYTIAAEEIEPVDIGVDAMLGGIAWD